MVGPIVPNPAINSFFWILSEGLIALIAAVFDKGKIFLVGILHNATEVEIIPLPAITALGVSLASLFFCLEIFSQMAQFRIERIEDAIRIAMKFIVCKIIIENSSNIAIGIYKMFRVATYTYIHETFDFIGENIASITLEPGDGGLMDMGYMLLFCALAAVGVYIISLYIKMAISFVGIAFEMGIHQAVAPIALATLCNDLARPTGIAFIKSYAATCLQVMVIPAIFQVFTTICGEFLKKLDLVTGSQLGIFNSVVKFIIPIILLMALNKAIKSASDITKRMFGA